MPPPLTSPPVLKKVDEGCGTVNGTYKRRPIGASVRFGLTSVNHESQIVAELHVYNFAVFSNSNYFYFFGRRFLNDLISASCA